MTATDLSWRPLGACHDLDPDIFYPSRGESCREAVAVCAACPVKAQCLEWALHHENFGIWGGVSEQARRRLRPYANAVLGLRPDDLAGST